MKKALKTNYEEPKLEVMAFINSDIITASGAEDVGVGDVGKGPNVDDYGWSNGANW